MRVTSGTGGITFARPARHHEPADACAAARQRRGGNATGSAQSSAEPLVWLSNQANSIRYAILVRSKLTRRDESRRCISNRLGCALFPDANDGSGDRKLREHGSAGGSYAVCLLLIDDSVEISVVGYASALSPRMRFFQWLHTNQEKPIRRNAPITTSKRWKYFPSVSQFSPSFMPT